MLTHAERCLEAVANYAYKLAESVRGGTLNVSAFDGLIESYIEQPAYSMEDKGNLRHVAHMFIGFAMTPRARGRE